MHNRHTSRRAVEECAPGAACCPGSAPALVALIMSLSAGAWAARQSRGYSSGY